MNFYKFSSRNHFIFLIAFLALFVIFLFLINYVQAKTFYVDDDGGADYTKIQDAINAAVEGDTVYVYAGNYTAPVMVDKTINLTGESRDTVILEVDEYPETGVWFEADWVNMSEFTIIRNHFSWSAGIKIFRSTNNKVFNNTILKMVGGDGIDIGLSENNIIYNNIVQNGDCGIKVWESKNNMIYNNNCSKNRWGIRVHESTNNIITINIISHNGMGIELEDSSNNTISNNICANNDAVGINLKVYYTQTQNNTISNNICSKNNYDGILIENSSINIISNNILSHNKNGIYLENSDNNSFSNNTCLENQKGIIFEYSNNNTFTRNLILNNTNFGAELKKNSLNNTFYHNTFIENNNASCTYNSSSIQAKDSCNNNSWYNKTSSNGNYWSDWTKPDKNKDGIVDEPYLINGSALSKDIYPFAYSFENLRTGVAYLDSILPNPALFEENIYLKGHGITFESNIKRYVWQSNIDGEFFNGTESNLSVSILSTGVHNITFMVITDFGFGPTQAFETLTIHERPIAQIGKISPNPAIEGEKIEFKGDGTDDGTITQTFWNSNIDGFLSRKESFSLSNLSIGNHTITLKVKDNFGVWSDLVTKKLEVKEITEKLKLIPKLKIPITTIYVGEIIILDASESIGDISKYFFDFGDNTNSGWISNSSINHNYSKSGIYLVKLKVKNFNGNESDNDVVELIVEKNEVRQKSEEKLWLGIILVVLLIITLIRAFVINRKSKLLYDQNRLSQRPYPPESRKQKETKTDDEFLKI